MAVINLHLHKNKKILLLKKQFFLLEQQVSVENLQKLLLKKLKNRVKNLI